MRRKKIKAAVAKPIAHQPLEQRVLLDAAAAATLADATTDVADENQFSNALRQLPSFDGASATQESDDSGSTKFSDSEFLDNAYLVGPQTQTREIFFIDTGVSNYEDLISEISPTASIYLIDTTTDGVEQISNLLANHSHVDAIHIITHSEKGKLNLGSAILTTDSMTGKYANELAQIGDALAERGDILIYGGDFAAGAEGEEAVALLASLTNADVGTSVNETSAVFHGGNLEHQSQTDVIKQRAIQTTSFDNIRSETDGDVVNDAIANLAEPGLSQTADHDSHVEAYEAYLAQSTSSELVVIDRAVSNSEEILNDIDPAAQVVFIDTAADGIEQLADILLNYDNLDALHIISHGEQGQLNLGTSALNEQTMVGEYADELAVIGDALAEHGDILIYGCDFAGGEEGAEAAALLAGLTGADIAASTDDTGAAVHGGDWDLEHAVGDVQTRTIAATSFSGILADTDGDGVDDAFDLDKDGDGILDEDEGAPPAEVLPPAGTLGVFDAFPADYRGFLQVVNDGAGIGAPAGQLFAFDASTNSYTPFPEAGGIDINALAYAENINAPVAVIRDAGGGLDAVGNALSQGDLVKFDADGEIFKIGTTQVSGESGTGADFVNGQLHARAGDNTIAVIDVTGAIGNTADQTVLTYNTGPRLASEQIAAGDILYQINNNSRTLTFWDTTTAVNGQTIATSSVTIANDPNNAIPFANAVFGAAFPATNAAGVEELYFSSNTTGAIYRIDGYTTGTPVAVQVAQGAQTGQNDGASPASAGIPFALDTDGDGIPDHCDLDSDNDLSLIHI